VVSSASLLDIIEDVGDWFGSSDGDWVEDAAQLFFLYELGGGSWGEGWSMTDSEHRYARISVALKPTTMGEIRTLVEQIEKWSGVKFGEGKVEVTGEGVPTAYLSKETVFEMLSGVGVGLLICALSIGLIFRSFGVVIVMLLCSIVPISSAFGLWAALGGDFGMGVSLVVATTIGLVIDDAIHFCSRFFSEQSGSGDSPLSRAGACIDEVAPAMVLTSIALVMGFSALLFSQFKLNYMFGVCTIFVVILALLFNLTVTPVLMAWLQRGASR
jgi:predicted RND superfamily exporter protein